VVFSSFLFLFLFLPVTISGYYLVPWRFKNLYLLIVSYLFYGWGAPTIMPILIGMSLFDYLLGGFLIPDENRSERTRKILLAFGITANLSLLFYYKYWTFFLSEFNTLLATLGFSHIIWSTVVLPIGISFFTFQKISYLVDLYRGTAKRAESFTQYALYVALFPQLIAGPIVRYHEIAEQLKARTHSWERAAHGFTRFAIGLAKKVLIADYLGQVADLVFALQPGELTTSYAWLGILAYTFQIYFDFSGYSDMAIGLGHIFGFQIPENFRNPYLARSFRDFWSRWHITLSNWMKEYLYIPLGGNRGSEFATARNLWIVFLLSGLWHGASWNFIVWGAYHGFFLSLERLLPSKFLNQNSPWRTLIIFPLIVLSWVLFRANTLEHAGEFYSYLFGFGAETLSKPVVWGDLIQNREWFVFLVAGLFTFVLAKHNSSSSESYSGIGTIAVAYPLLLLSLCALAGMDYAPFLYFRF
jgi:alginate O-acetyltransferase complex protein AlgI